MSVRAGLELLPEDGLRQLCAAGAALSVAVSAMENGGFSVRVSYSTADSTTGDRLLRTARGAVRRFGSLHTAALFLKEMGCPAFTVDMGNYQPLLVRPPRPDRSEALRKTRTSPKQESLPL